MIGQFIECRSRQLYWGVGLMLAAAGVLALAVQQDYANLAMFAVLPLCLGFSLAIFSPRRIGAELGEEGLLLNGKEIRYDAIDLIAVNGREYDESCEHVSNARLTIQVGEKQFNFSLDEKMPLRPLCAFLLDRMPQREVYLPDARLYEYYLNQTETFGADRVWAFSARRSLTAKVPKFFLALSVAVLLTTVAWGIASSMTRNRDWPPVAGAMFGLLVGSWAVYIVLHARDAHAARTSKSAMVIGPRGLALVHEPFRGQVTWDELRNLNYFDRMNAKILRLTFAGAHIDLKDVFKPPLAHMHSIILKHWKH